MHVYLHFPLFIPWTQSTYKLRLSLIVSKQSRKANVCFIIYVISSIMTKFTICTNFNFITWKYESTVIFLIYERYLSCKTVSTICVTYQKIYFKRTTSSFSLALWSQGTDDITPFPQKSSFPSCLTIILDANHERRDASVGANIRRSTKWLVILRESFYTIRLFFLSLRRTLTLSAFHSLESATWVPFAIRRCRCRLSPSSSALPSLGLLPGYHRQSRHSSFPTSILFIIQGYFTGVQHPDNLPANTRPLMAAATSDAYYAHSLQKRNRIFEFYLCVI